MVYCTGMSHSVQFIFQVVSDLLDKIRQKQDEATKMSVRMGGLYGHPDYPHMFLEE